jgi:nitrate reductase delta subunit
MTAREPGRWDAVSTLLLYPDAQAEADLTAASEWLIVNGDGLAEAARRFARFVADSDASVREERFTRTFDINPACSLELGWHLYGEDYKRGAFLVDMRQLIRGLGIEETQELPDHLIHALRCLERLPSPKVEQFSTAYLQPALSKMLEGYTSEDCPWRPVLVALLRELEAEYGETHLIESVPSAASPEPYEGSVSCSGMPVAPPARSPE